MITEVSKQPIKRGVMQNIPQIALQLIQVFLVGLTIGMTRTVIPGLADSEFGLAKKQFLLLVSFVVVFGVVKAIMNLFAGSFSDNYGRKLVLVMGWVMAIPIPFMILYAQSWNWIVFATLFLGFNQGLCWSMTINSKLDLARLDQKGLVNGINEFSGYVGVAIAGLITAYFVDLIGARQGLFIFGLVVICLGLVLAIFFVKETMAFAKLEQKPSILEPKQSLAKLFVYASWHNKILLSLNQAGLVEKFADSIVWIFLPVFFLHSGLNLVEGSAIILIYGVVWGGLQLVTGPLSDKIGRKVLIVGGMWLCALGLISIPYSNSVLLWSVESAIIGAGMAMLYPTLGAAVADFSPAEKRGTLLGIYRFWRDFGYAISALTMGLVAQWTQALTSPFLLASLVMVLSGGLVFVILPSDRLKTTKN